MSAPEQTEVIDEDGRVWTLTGTSLGSGGQGEVFRVVGHRYAVKRLHSKQLGMNDVLRDQIAAVRRLAIDDLPIAKPIALLRPPEVGYVMHLIDGVIPLETLLPPSDRMPDLVEWHQRAGGLRRRLDLLARLADVLSRLHGRAIVFGDLSPYNVLVSADPMEHEVWLIDPDNLRDSSVGGRRIYTPGYGAPELQARGGGPLTTLAEAFTFAILAYEILTLKHPLTGGKAAEGDAELEARARLGELPWVGHPDDTSNAQAGGFPASAVMTNRLLRLCARSFGEGLHQPQVRPGLDEWRRELRWAADLTLRCPFCQATFLAANKRCPWCDAARPRLLLVTIAVCDERGRIGTGDLSPRLAVAHGDQTTITRAAAIATASRTLADQDTPVAHVSFIEDRVRFTADADEIYWRPGAEEPLDVGRAVPMRAEKAGLLKWTAHFGPSGTLHRLAQFQVVDEAPS